MWAVQRFTSEVVIVSFVLEIDTLRNIIVINTMCTYNLRRFWFQVENTAN